MATVTSPQELFEHELQDMYYAEKTLINVLPKLAFARRIDDLERIVASRAAAVRKPVASMESGPHPVAA